MKQILYIICSLFLLSSISSVSWALPPCVANAEVWDNCVGTHTWDNGDKYVGEWKDDKKHGKGKFTWASGNMYEGDWEDDNYHGKGKYTWANGGMYEGDWKDDKKHGKGTFSWSN